MYRLKGCILEVLGGNMGALFAIDIAACDMGGSGTDLVIGFFEAQTAKQGS